MREILFRGKRLHDNKWIYGNFISDYEGNPHIIEPRFFCEDGHHLQYEDNTDTPVFIIPETVGQYTGLTDKNGVRIFEGDIIQSLESSVTGLVQWFPEHSAFMVWCKSANEVGFLYECADIIKVIGNIHDNPELLKGGDDNE